MDRLHKEIQRNPDRRNVVSHSLSHSLVQFDKEYYPGGIGISMIGESDAEGDFQFEHSFPYVIPGDYPYVDEVQIDKISDRAGYYGLIDNINLSVIFFIQNTAAVTGMFWKGAIPGTFSVRISGLSLSASILLPLQKSDSDILYESEKRRDELRKIRSARHGNQKLIEKMMMDEMDVRDTLDHRAITEDVLSIVDSSMIPYSLQCDTYDIIGTILTVKEIENSQTREQIYLMDVACLYYVIRIAVNKQDLVGEPMPGRRFRGVTWLQGTVSLDSIF